MNTLFEVRQTPELMREIDRIIRDLRNAGSPADIREAFAFETDLRAEAAQRIWNAFARAQAPAIDSEVTAAMDRLRLTVKACPRQP